MFSAQGIRDLPPTQRRLSPVRIPLRKALPCLKLPPSSSFARPLTLSVGVIGAYYGISAAGFGILNSVGISYIDDRILWAGIPMMIVLAGLALWAQSDRHAMINPCQLWFRWDYTPLFLIPFLSVATFIGVFVEAGLNGSFSLQLICATILALLIGFAKEATFRRYILDLDRTQSIVTTVAVFVYSVLAFAFVHMMNVFSGLPVAEAFSQSLYTIRFGVVAALIYLVTKNFLALVCWRAVTDFGLFAGQIGDFQSVAYIGQAIDWVMWVSTGLAAIYGLIRLFKYLRDSRRLTHTQ